jgi:integrase
MVFRRLSKKTSIHITAHALRRTFAILSLRAGVRPLHLQHLGGWQSLDMVDDDLLQEHKAHSPIDRFIAKANNTEYEYAHTSTVDDL